MNPLLKRELVKIIGLSAIPFVILSFVLVSGIAGIVAFYPAIPFEKKAINQPVYATIRSFLC